MTVVPTSHATVADRRVNRQHPSVRAWPALPRPVETAAVRSALLDGGGVLLVGPAGVGKTHLLSVALGESGAAGTPGCDPVEPDLVPFVTLPGGTVGPDEPFEVVFPDLAVLPPAAAPGLAPLVRVEDAHLLPMPVAVRLARLASDRVIRLAVTLRSGAAAHSPWVDLWKDARLARVDVGPLADDDVAQLLDRALGGPVSHPTLDRLCELARGNPFYLCEIVRAALTAGTLQERDGRWVGEVEAAPSPRVLDAVSRDLDRLSTDTRAALELVALAEPLALERVLTHVTPAALAALEEEHLLALVEDEEGHRPAVCTSHPVYGAAVRHLVPVERRLRIFAAVRSQIASPVAHAHESPASIARSVEWALGCGVHETVARLVEGVAAALHLGRWAEAVRFADVALERLGREDRRWATVLLQRARAWRMLDEPGRAMRDLDLVADRLEAGALDPDVAVRFAEQRADLELFATNDGDAAIAQVEAVRAHLGPAATAADVRALEVSRLVRLAQAGRVQEVLEPALGLLARPGPEREEALRLVNLVVLGLGAVGRFREAAQTAERFGALGHTFRPWPAWVVNGVELVHAMVSLWEGRPDAAERGLVAARGTRRGGGDDPFAMFVQAMLESAHGSWSEARAGHTAVSARLTTTDPTGVLAYVAAVESTSAAATGDPTTARELVELARTIPLRAAGCVESDLRLHLLDTGAWLGSMHQQPDAVRLARWCADRGLHRGELEALHRAVLAHPARASGQPGMPDLVERIRALGGVVEGPRAAALVAHAEALALGDPSMVEVAAHELATCGLWLPTARRAANLTRREREIAALAAGGLSSRHIADRLTVSVRTVDSHLSRVYAKLSVRSRRDLAQALRD